MKGILRAVAEGGQTWAHRMRMIRQVLKISTWCALLSGALVIGITAYKLPSTRYKAVWYQIAASMSSRVQVDTQFWGDATHQYYSGKTVELSAARVKKVCEREIDLLVQAVIENGIKALKVATYVFGGFLGFCLLRGLKSQRKQHVSGTKLAPAWKVSLKLRLSGKASFLKVGQLRLVKGAETQHFLVTGGTGSGKTTLFHHMLPQIRKVGQRAIIVDTTGDYTEKYFRPGKDILLNPFDERSATWNPWVECRDQYDYHSLAESFIPQSYCEKENYWRTAGRSVFTSVLQLMQDRQDIDQLVKLMLYEPLGKLCETVFMTKAAAHLDMASDKTAASIRSVSVSFLECLETLKASDDPFSIRDWVEKTDDDSWLFLSALPAQRAIIGPLISTWLSIGMRSLIQMPADFNRRLWFVVDELPTLHKVKDLQMCLTESRKYGGCFLGAVQTPAQLEMIYGPDATKVISGNCNTKITFYERDPQVAQGISRIFGENETVEYKEGISYGANTVRDGVSLSPESKRKPVVSASQIQSLDKCEAFVQLPGKIPVSKVKLKYSK